MNKPEIMHHWVDLNDLMSAVKTHCDKLITEFSTGSPEHLKVLELTVRHDPYQQFFQQPSPTDDICMEELATHVWTYYKMTNGYITDLGSVGSGMPAYDELANAHSGVKDWYEKVLQSVGGTPSPAPSPSASPASVGAPSPTPLRHRRSLWARLLGSLPPSTSPAPGGAPPPPSSPTPPTSAGPGGGSSPPPPPAGPAPGGAPHPPSSKSLFIALLNHLRGTLSIDQAIVNKTVELFDYQQGAPPIPLADNEIAALLAAWQQVVNAFKENPPGTTLSSDPIEAIISFDVVHSDLEKLYNQLTTNVKRTSEDSLDSFLSSVY